MRDTFRFSLILYVIQVDSPLLSTISQTSPYGEDEKQSRQRESLNENTEEWRRYLICKSQEPGRLGEHGGGLPVWEDLTYQTKMLGSLCPKAVRNHWKILSKEVTGVHFVWMCVWPITLVSMNWRNKKTNLKKPVRLQRLNRIMEAPL